MTYYLVVASLFSVIITAIAALTRRVSSMSDSTNALFSALSDLSVQVAAVSAKVAELKASQPDPAEAAAVAKAVTDIQAATAALKAVL